jgi:hypothetical protein
MKTGTKILLGLLGAGVVGGAIAVAVSSSGSSGNADAPSQPGTLVKPPGEQNPNLVAYKVLPNCGGFEVVDIKRSMAYARLVTQNTPAAGWDKAVAEELYGPVCNALDGPKWQQLIKDNPVFLYRVLVGVLQGAQDMGYHTVEQGEALLAAARDQMIAAGVAKKDLTPTTVFGDF